MRILIVHNFYKQYGGEDQMVHEQVKLLNGRGNEVFLYSKNNNELPRNKYKVFKEAYYSINTIKELNEIIFNYKPEIAHIHNIFPQISPSVYDVLAGKGIPIIQTLHNYRLACPNGLFFNKGKVCTLCLEKGDFYYCAIKRCYRNSYIQSYWYSDILNKNSKIGIFGKIDKFIALNEFMREIMIRKGYSSDKIVVIPNGISCTNGPNFHKKNYLVYVGRLSKEKGIFTLIEAIELLPNIQLKILGDGDEKNKLVKYIQKKNIKNIEFLGFLNGQIKDEIIEHAKAIIVPSEWYENFPTVVLEALSLGTMAIVSKTGGLQHMIKDNYNGLLFQSTNSMDLKAKIRYTIENDQKLLEMSKNAYESFINRYSSHVFYDNLINLYNQLLKNG